MKNLRFTFRMLRRNPLLLFVNLPGLAVGLSAVLLLSLYIRHEISFDKHFTTKDRVLRLYNEIIQDEKSEYLGICLRESYVQIPAKVPEIQAATQLFRGWEVNVKFETNNFSDVNLMYADPSFFEVFDKELIFGDKHTALAGDKKVVISASLANKIFKQLDCVGQAITISNEPFIVTGIMEDLPKATHFSFEMLASMQTVRPNEFGGLDFFTYFLIDKNADIDQVGKKIAAANDELLAPWAKHFIIEVKSGTELLENIHLLTKLDWDLSEKVNLTYLFIIGGIAFFILLIALINYINLYVLHGEKRIGEIAARKSLGANPLSLACLFYTETGLISIMAFLFVVVISIVALPFFATLMQQSLTIADLFSPSGILTIIGFLFFLILISGAYPTFYLSKIKLVNALKGSSENVRRKSKLSAIAVLVQFSVTVFLITTLVVVYAQVNFLKNVPLGFSHKDVIGIDGLNAAIQHNFSSVKSELERLSFVESVGCSYHHMGGGCSGQGIRVYGKEEGRMPVDQYRVQAGFCETMKLHLVEGRYFRDNESDKKSIVLNEAAVKQLGLVNPVGTLVQMHEEPLEVIGVVSDFYYSGHPGEPIGPLALTEYSDEVEVIYLRVSGAFSVEKSHQIAAILKRYDPDYIFRSFYLSDIYKSKFDNEQRVMKLVSVGTSLAILVSFIGLMALSIMNVAGRTKEIGIRKVMGSTETEVIGILLRDTIKLVFISMIIAFCVGYVVMRSWLDNFADRIPLHFAYFLISGFFALFIALLAISWQTWRAATRNPVKALRYE